MVGFVEGLVLTGPGRSSTFGLRELSFFERTGGTTSERVLGFEVEGVCVEEDEDRNREEDASPRILLRVFWHRLVIAEGRAYERYIADLQIASTESDM